MRLARVSQRDGWSVDRALEQYELSAPRRSRRAFLQQTAASLAGLAATSCTPTRLPGRAGPSVAIVGAGLAGLVCAYRLQRAGVNVRVFEAQTRTGGRILSLRNHFAAGQIAELGGELIDSGHERLRSLVAELGFALDDYTLDAPELARSVWHFGGRARTEREVVAAFTPLSAAIERDRALLGDGAVDRRSPPPVAALDRLSLAEWLDQNGATGWIRALLEVAYTTEMGLAPDRQSALNLLTFIGSEPDPFRIFGESDERFHLREGNDSIPRELARRLAGRVELGTVLESVRQFGAGDFRLTVRRDATVREVRASHVVLAMPLTMLRRIELAVPLPEPTRRAIAALAYGTNAKLMIGFSRRCWRDAGSDGSSFADLAYQSSWDSSRLQPGAAGMLTNFTGGARGIELGQGTAAAQAARCVQDLEEVYPGVTAARAGMTEARFHWPSHPWTLGSYVCPGPGDWTAYGGVFDGAFGRLRFAGEHCSATAQGFMEGACESGERTAAELLAELGRERVSISQGSTR